MILPTEKSIPQTSNPKFLVYFGKPKSGKTTIASKLENNLIIDLENGTDFLSALVVKANNVPELSDIASSILKANKEAGKYVYDYITIDNGTKLEEMIMPLALQLYQQTPSHPLGHVAETLYANSFNCWDILTFYHSLRCICIEYQKER
jgi:hypothetical protein